MEMELTCPHCEDVFEGFCAEEDLRDHIQYYCTEHILRSDAIHELESLLIEKFPFIISIEEVRNRYDDPDMILVHRNDGTSYEVFYRGKGIRSFFDDSPPESDFAVVSRGIEATESYISEIIEGVRSFAPDSNFQFVSYRSNLGGYYGSGYDFSFEAFGQTHTVRKWKNHGSMEQFFRDVRSYFSPSIEGKLEKFNNEYFVNGISINEWIRQNVGKEIKLEKK